MVVYLHMMLGKADFARDLASIARAGEDTPECHAEANLRLQERILPLQMDQHTV